jgi:hypothetical protein
MSKKTERTSTIQYDPTSMNTFTQLQSPFAGYVTDALKNPFMSEAFKARVEMGNKQALSLGDRYKNNLLQNPFLLTSNPSAFTASQLAKAGRATGTLQANSFLQNLVAQEGIRQNAAQMAYGYKPLQTGEKMTEKVSGTGTWLPQLLGAGLQAGLAFATGGASLAPLASASAAANGASHIASGMGSAFSNAFMQPAYENAGKGWKY